MSKNTKVTTYAINESMVNSYDDTESCKYVLKSLGHNWDSVNKSTDLYCSLTLACVRHGLLDNDDVSPKRQRAFQAGQIASTTSMPHFGLSNGSHSISKTVTFSNTGDHHAPNNELNDASRKLSDRRAQFELISTFICKILKADMHVYMMTLTTPNQNYGTLKVRANRAKKRGAQLKKAIKDFADRGSGLALPAVGGSTFNYLGSLTNSELTLNADKLKDSDFIGVYHFHEHILLIGSNELDVKKAKKILFDRWQKLNPDLDLSEDAFDLESVYSKHDNSIMDDNVALEAAVEATKYLTKPDAYFRLRNCKNQEYAERIFAEIYKFQHGPRSNRASGIMWEAVHVLNLLGKFRNALTFAMSSDFPDVITHLLDFPDYRTAVVQNNRELTSSEILYFNRDLIKNLFSDFSLANFDLTRFLSDAKDMANNADDDVKSNYQEMYASVSKELANDTHHIREWIEVIKSVDTFNSKNEVVNHLRKINQIMIDALTADFDYRKYYDDNANSMSNTDKVGYIKAGWDNGILMPDAERYRYMHKSNDLNLLITAIVDEIPDKLGSSLAVGENGIPEMNPLRVAKGVQSKYFDFSGRDLTKIKKAIGLNDVTAQYLSIPKQQFYLRKIDLLLATTSKAIAQTGLHTRYASNLSDNAYLLNAVAYADLHCGFDFTGRRHYDYNTAPMSFDTFQKKVVHSNTGYGVVLFDLTVKQQRVFYDAMVDYYFMCSAVSLNHETVKHMEPATITMGFHSDNFSVGCALFGFDADELNSAENDD